MIKEFKVIYDLYSPPDKDGNQKIIKSNLIKRKSITIEEIKSVEQMTSSKGKVLLNQCVIEYGNDKVIVVKHKYTELADLMKGIVGHNRVLGFKYKGRN